MPTLPANQIAQLAANAGFSGNNLVTAVAVCLAESGGNTQAINHNSDGSTDYGLWQINSVHGLNPADMFDPAKNAAAAFSVAGGGVNWRPWATYNNGAYRAFMAQGLAATAGVAPGTAVLVSDLHIPGTNIPIPGTGWIPDLGAGVANGVSNGVSGATNLLDAINSLLSVFGSIGSAVAFVVNPGNWERLGFVVAGSAIILLTISKLAADTPIGSAVIKTTEKVGEVAAI